MKLSLAASAEFITEWEPLQPLPELVHSNSKQESYPWMRPEAVHCSLEASKSESCCQATVYRWRGGAIVGSSTAAHTLACPSSSSRQDQICLALNYYFYFPKRQQFTAVVQTEI